VQHCADGKLGIEALSDRPDLVLTDLRLPVADGIEVMRKTHERYPELPVIVITAFGSIPGAVDAMRLGAFDYLTKPLPTPDTLREVVARALAARRASRAR
jgi:two-component system response regulator AtoC